MRGSASARFNALQFLPVNAGELGTGVKLCSLEMPRASVTEVLLELLTTAPYGHIETVGNSVGCGCSNTIKPSAARVVIEFASAHKGADRFYDAILLFMFIVIGGYSPTIIGNFNGVV